MNRFSRMVLLLFGAVAFSAAAWCAVGRFTAETFLPLGMRFSGVGEDIARPIVERLYVAMRVGLTAAPWLFLFCLVRPSSGRAQQVAS